MLSSKLGFVDNTFLKLKEDENKILNMKESIMLFVLGLLGQYLSLCMLVMLVQKLTF